MANRGPDRWSSVMGLSREKRLTTATGTDRCDDPSLSEAMQEVATGGSTSTECPRSCDTAESRRRIGVERSARHDSGCGRGAHDRATVDDNVLAVHPLSARSVRIIAMLRRPGRTTLTVGAAFVLDLYLSGSEWLCAAVPPPRHP